MKLIKSEKKKTKIKLAIQGCSGSGKTYSSLLIANGLSEDCSKVAVIDTENGSANLYSHLGNYNVVTMKPPYSPEKYIEAITLCEKADMNVIIIDSISHCWGYLIQTHSKMQGNSFTNWNKITPRQNAFINKVLQSNLHIISTMRVKQDYVLNYKNGKYIPERIGLKAIQRNDLDYEFTIAFDLDIRHNARVSKDRTGLFIDKSEFIISVATGKKILDWCNETVIDNLGDINQEISNCKTIEGLRHIFSKYPNLQEQLKEKILKRKRELESIRSQIVSNSNVI